MMLALLISIAALILSAVSLSWQVYSWKRTGPVLKVSVSHSAPTYGPRNDVVGDWHTTVTAVNGGRTAATVTSWGFEMPDGRTLVPTEHLSWADPLPGRIEPHAKASWHIRKAELVAACEDFGVRHQDTDS
jgi:hypothetical protein